MILENKKEKFFIEVLKEVNEAFQVFGMKAWLDSGILLKNTRGQKIFPSSDIDFGINVHDSDNIIEFANYLKKKDFLIRPTGNLPVIFEGLTISKRLNLNYEINVDLCIYYPLNNYLCRPNMHKPLKQSIKSQFLYILLNKTNLFLHKGFIKNNKFLKNSFIYLYFLISKVYFNYGVTSQFVIPKKYFHRYKKIKIENISFLLPEKAKKYVEWRYGKKWQVPDSNWRLNNGNMVILDNLKKYWIYYINSKYFPWIKLKLKNKKKTKSIFYFSEKELKSIRKSKIKF